MSKTLRDPLEKNIQRLKACKIWRHFGRLQSFKLRRRIFPKWIIYNRTSTLSTTISLVLSKKIR